MRTVFKKPPNIRESRAKSLFRHPVSFEKTGFLRTPHQWTPQIQPIHIGEKVATQKKVVRPSGGALRTKSVGEKTTASNSPTFPFENLLGKTQSQLKQAL
jgi:hypothetical protein